MKYKNKDFLGYFSVLSVSISISSIVVAFILYISVDPSFSMFSHWISDLGTGSSGAGLIFNSGLIISGGFALVFHFFLIRDLREKEANKILINLLFVLGYISAISLIFVGLFPLSISSLIHGIAASVYFIGTFNYCIVYGLSIFLVSKISKIQSLISFISATFFGLHLISLIQLNFVPVILLEIAKFTEWLTLFAIDSWILEVGLYTSKIFKKLVLKAKL